METPRRKGTRQPQRRLPQAGGELRPGQGKPLRELLSQALEAEARGLRRVEDDQSADVTMDLVGLHGHEEGIRSG